MTTSITSSGCEPRSSDSVGEAPTDNEERLGRRPPSAGVPALRRLPAHQHHRPPVVVRLPVEQVPLRIEHHLGGRRGHLRRDPASGSAPRHPGELLAAPIEDGELDRIEGDVEVAPAAGPELVRAGVETEHRVAASSRWAEALDPPVLGERTRHVQEHGVVTPVERRVIPPAGLREHKDIAVEPGLAGVLRRLLDAERAVGPYAPYRRESSARLASAAAAIASAARARSG